MIKKIVLLLTFVLVVGLQAQTTLSMELWTRYSMTRTNSKTTQSTFSLERGYLRLDPTFSDKIKGRFNLDFFSSDKYNDGAGLKLKYAYVEFNQLVPIKYSKVVVGLDKTYFGTIYDWEYMTIEKALEDKEKIVSSADYGISLNGSIPNGFGEYAVALVNGEGYSKAGSKLNINPAPMVNLRLIPLSGVTFGGSMLYEKANFTDTIRTAYDKRLDYTGVLKLAYGPVDAWFEYLVQQYGVTTRGVYNETKSQGFMIMPVVHLGLAVDLVGRYDMWDKDTKTANDAYSRIIGGLNWNILRDAQGSPNLFIQANWQHTTFQNNTVKPTDEMMIQLRWKFSNTLN
jgi:hypothetical protein